jgi:hypothetical protein
MSTKITPHRRIIPGGVITGFANQALEGGAPMDLIKLRIPAAFVLSRTPMSWREIRFGIENELLDPDAPVDLAMKQLVTVEHPSVALVDLATLGKHEPTERLVDQLAGGEPERPSDEMRDKWLYVVLAWLYENQGGYQDPLQTVEEVYADFGYPAQMRGFVRYNPMDGPDLGSREANERRLLERWKRYLDETAPARIIHHRIAIRW